MASKSIDLAPFIQSVFPAFFPGGNLQRITRLEGGHIHATFRVEWEKGAHVENTVFQRLNPNVFKKPELLAQNCMHIASHLEEKEYPRKVLHPIHTPDGEAIIWASDDPWRAFPFLSGTYTQLFTSDVEEVRKAAMALGEWHTFLKEMDPAKIQAAIPGFFDVENRWRQWEEAKSNALSARGKQALDEITQLESRKELVFQFKKLKKENLLPLRILHGDPKLSNLLFDTESNEVHAIIDWDTVQPGWIVFDFGDMVRAYTNPCVEDEPDVSKVNVHPPYLEALRDGFLEKTGSWLTPAEKQHLFLGAQWVIWVQALRFLADYLVGDTYYPVAYETHNLVRARNQLKLLESFEFLIFNV